MAFPTMSQIIFQPLPYATAASAKAAGKITNHVGIPNFPPWLESCAIIGWILCLTFAFALTFFVGFHSYLVTRGKTTIELYESSDPERMARIAEYNVGASRNWRLACGNVPLCWPFPVRAYIEGDGLDWPRNDSIDNEALLASEHAV